MRKVPLEGARALGRWTRRSRLIPPIYVLVAFFVIPLLLLGLSALFNQGSVGFNVLGAFLVILVVYGIARFVWFWKRKDGRAKFISWLDRRQEMSNTRATLPEDMQYLKAKVSQLAEHTGLPEDEEEEGVEVEALKPVDEEQPKESSDATAEEEPAAAEVETKDE